MKRFKKPSFSVFLLFLAGLVSFFAHSCASGPDPVADKVIRDYEGLTGVYTFRIPPGLVTLAMSDQHDRDIEEFLSGMETIKVIVINLSETKDQNLSKITDRFTKALNEENFEDLMEVNQSGNRILVKIHEQDNKTDEAMIMVSSEDAFLGLSLVGDIDMQALGKIAYKISKDEFRIGTD